MAGNNNDEIRIIKKKHGGHGHHGGAWKVAYADFVTAMMAFFLVMWIIGLSPTVKEAVQGYFKDPVAFMEAVQAGNAAFQIMEASQGGPNPNADPNIPSVGPSGKPVAVVGDVEKIAEKQRLNKTKQAIERIVAQNPEFKDLKKNIEIKINNEGMKIDLLESQKALFFDSASSQIKPKTRLLLKQIAGELGKLPNQVVMEGHTDSRKLNRQDGYTNWELSADRANAARQVMEVGGLRRKQVSQVRGYADTQPKDPKKPEHFTNRRVSIVVVMNNNGAAAAKAVSEIKKSLPAASPDIKHGNAHAPAKAEKLPAHSATKPDVHLPSAMDVFNKSKPIHTYHDELPGEAKKPDAHKGH